jgi:hypothetical protein
MSFIDQLAVLICPGIIYLFLLLLSYFAMEGYTAAHVMEEAPLQGVSTIVDEPIKTHCQYDFCLKSDRLLDL